MSHVTPATDRSLALVDLAAAYRERSITPLELVQTLFARIAQIGDRGIWITLLPELALQQAQVLGTCDPASLPLYGVPFAIKDNIDLAGVPTTAGCPAFAYTPGQSAFVVNRLLEAGAILIGKTNLDQFATGLVGTRSPYGVCRNSFNPQYISGGSSSGSAVAVAMGLASFALGTDTAGSGRIPAAFNNIVGLKPTCGRLSTRGVVPACRTLDAISIFALSAQDAARVCRVAEGFDQGDAYSRQIAPPARSLGLACGAFRFGVPQPQQLQFFGNEQYPRLFDAAVARLEALGGQRVLIDFAPFVEAAQLLYDGPWIAERYVVIEQLLRDAPDCLHPITRQIIAGGAAPSAADAFRAQYRLQSLRRASERVWNEIDVLVTPTAGTIYRIAEVEANPLQLNSRLGFYTNFMNLLDLAAVAVPAGFSAEQLPFGITLAGPTWSDFQLLALAGRFQHSEPSRQGALSAMVPAEPDFGESDFGWQRPAEAVVLAVCGAHLDGLPLNHQLREVGAVLLERTRTAARYRFYALQGGPPERPGLVRVEQSGAAIEVELWSMPAAALGGFLARIPAPLAIGKLELADDTRVCGFLCEAHAVNGAVDITQHGGWRAYLASLSGEPGSSALTSPR
jgi:allophanate hydrolase